MLHLHLTSFTFKSRHTQINPLIWASSFLSVSPSLWLISTISHFQSMHTKPTKKKPPPSLVLEIFKRVSIALAESIVSTPPSAQHTTQPDQRPGMRINPFEFIKHWSSSNSLTYLSSYTNPEVLSNPIVIYSSSIRSSTTTVPLFSSTCFRI